MTIRDLAKELGLGKSTVAAALRGNPCVKEETRKIVQEQAERLGYRFNPMASAFLRQVRAKGSIPKHARIAVMLPSHGESDARLRISVKALSQGIRERATELGYKVDHVDQQQYSSAEVTRSLIAKGTLGLIIGPLTPPISRLNLDCSKCATVAFGDSHGGPALHRVSPDYLQGIRQAVRQCRNKGFHRIGLILTTEGQSRSNGAWLAGYLELQQEIPKSGRLEVLLLSDAALTKARLHSWIERHRPDAVIFHCSGEKNRDVQELAARGILPVMLDRMPGDSCPGIDQKYRRCGATLVDALSSQILHNERGTPVHPRTTLVAGSWID